MRTLLSVLTLFVLLGFGGASVRVAASEPLLTPWGEALLNDHRAFHAGQQTQPVQPWREYPRPTLIRANWLNLNGYWELFVPGPESGPTPVSRPVLVPFPVESRLSGVGRPLRHLGYRTRFAIPAAWSGQRILLHFGAVDAETVVLVNGREVGRHHGAYDPFTFDITDFLYRPEDALSATPVPTPRENVLEVYVSDPTEQGRQMRGKQSSEPSGIWYTSASGIWQTVWLEPVAESHIRAIDVETDIETGAVNVRLDVARPKENHFVAVEIFLDGRSLAKLYGGLDGPLRLTLPREEIRLWSPESPVLYDVDIRLHEGEKAVDQVRGYFALRTITIEPDERGHRRVHLNGRPIFLHGIIDQGYWPDGITTPPSDAAVETDIRTMKVLGFNTIRKLAKIEPERWYAWCDRLGMLVWQDIPNANNRTPEGREAFARELQAVVEARRRHPSLVAWTLFNEGHGQHRTAELVELLRQIDPGRPINAASGWNDEGVGDFHDVHKFPGPAIPTPPDPARALLCGSYGGYTLIVPGHLWTRDTWGYRHVADSETLLARYVQLQEELATLIPYGLAGAAFHQFADTEGECNGLVTYDRRRLKIPAEQIQAVNRTLAK